MGTQSAVSLSQQDHSVSSITQSSVSLSQQYHSVSSITQSSVSLCQQYHSVSETSLFLNLSRSQLREDVAVQCAEAEFKKISAIPSGLGTGSEPVHLRFHILKVFSPMILDP